ncbi:cysteine synthase family protein [Spartinivicinus ruber]|uniref:cysteine synthase family protein n=1 Tax=Spartinivicinus ruber TaxID=2683272 RepID=UPI0013CFFD40|nr:cysteine synthase family protein [Spartinivicinus ruber]
MLPVNSPNAAVQSLLVSSHYCAKSLYDAIGKVPIVRLNQLDLLCKQHNIYIKLDSCNPSGSIKDKNAVYLIKQAEEQGLLKPRGTIIESSSGNFGLALASIGASKGYQVIIVIDAKTPPPVIKMLHAYGASLVEVPLTLADEAGSMQKARMAKARQLASEIPNAFYPCQHLNPDNPTAHQAYTAKEIAAEFPTPPDAIVIGVSTAGQLAGIARYFRDYSPNTEIICVDVAGSAILGMPRYPYKMIGLGLSFVPPAFDLNYLDYGYNVEDHIAFSMCHLLAKKEGLLLGASTGAIVSAGLAYLQLQSQAKTIVLINPDRGDRYLDTVYNAEWLAQQHLTLLNRRELMQAINTIQPVVFPENSKGAACEKR